MAPVNEFRCTWSNTETKILINLVKELNLANDLCLKHHNADIFQRLSFEFQSRHNIIRRQDQIRLRWKLLKQEYMRAKKSNCVDGMSKSTQSLYEDLDLLLGRYVSVSKHRVTAEPHHSHEHFVGIMVRNYVRKTERVGIPHQMMAAAARAVIFDGKSLRTAAAAHGINYMTLHRYVRKVRASVAAEENAAEYMPPRSVTVKSETLDPIPGSSRMPIPGPSSALPVSADNFLQSLDLYQSGGQQQRPRRSAVKPPIREWTVPPQGGPPVQKQQVAPQPPPMKKPQPQPVQAPKPPAPKPPPPRPVSPPQPPPPPPEVCLRWNSYHSNMQATFPSLLNNEQFVDVTLACEGRSIKCHKMMLSACSAYFEELLSQNPCQHPIVLMKDLRYWEVQALVDFMYRGEVNVGQDKLPSLLAAAEALQIKGLAGPASTSSSHDEDSLPPSLPLGSAEDYMDESTPSPSSARRARKRRVMASIPMPQPQPQPLVPVTPSRNPVGRPRLSRTSAPLPSTSAYHQDSPLPSEPPLRRARKSDSSGMVGEIKIEPIDIDISNESMDPGEDSYLNKETFDGSTAGDGGESSGQGDEGGGGENSLDHKTILHGRDSEQQMNYGNNNGMTSDSTGNDTKLEDYPYEPGNASDAGMSSAPDLAVPTYPEVVMNPGGGGGGGSGSGDSHGDHVRSQC